MSATGPRGDTAPPQLPHGLATTWGVAELPQRGPKRELSTERIVEAAIDIADSDGLEAVSMGKVASALGFTTMSLYRYVTGKDDLLLLMLDAASDVPLMAHSGDWREQTKQWAAIVRAGYRAHPWLADMPPSSTPTTPNRLAIVDAGLRALRSLEMREGERITVVMLLLGYIGMFEKASRDDLDPQVRGVLPALVSEERFPYLAPFVARGYFDQPMSNDAAFHYGLHRFLDGIGDAASEAPSAETAIDMPPEVTRDKQVREAAKAVQEAEKRLADAQRKAASVVAKAVEREQVAAEKARAKANKRARK